MSEAARTSPSQALTRHSRGPGWIWAVPIAALGIVAWLLVRLLAEGGTNVTIMFPDAHNVSPDNTEVHYRGMKIGHVTDVSLTKDGSAVRVTANIQETGAEKLLTTGTVFWLQGATPSLGSPASLGAVISGPTIVMEAGPGTATRQFNGLVHTPLPDNHGSAVLFTVAFDGPVGELSPGEVVKVRGFPVGEVEEIGFRYDASTGKIETPVKLALYPELFHIHRAPSSDNGLAFRAALGRLVEEGLRARLDRDPPLVGSYRVALEMVSGAPPASIRMVNGMPEIPSASGGGLDAIVTQVKNVPIEQIGQHVLAVAKHLDTVVSSPALQDSVDQLDASLRQIREVAQSVGPKVDKLVQSLHQTAGQLEQTAQRADKTLGGAESQGGMTQTLHEIKEAAQSVRSLADYLEQHPESILSGKPKG